jgi:hypothetical protein
MKYLRIIVLFICIRNYNIHGEQIIFRYDDYGIKNDNISTQLFRFFNDKSIPLLVSVVPFYCKDDKIFNNSFPDSVILSNNIFTIGMHGYSHKNNNINNVVSEFYGVSLNQQIKMIKEGKIFLEEIFHKPVSFFIPPWNSYDENTLKALEYNYISSLSAARYNAPNVKDSYHIRYIPYTITLGDFINVFKNIQNKTDRHKDDLIIIMMHPYDFLENNSEKGIVSLNEFSNLIKVISSDSAFNIISVDNIAANEFSYKRLLNNAYIKLRVPKFLLFESIYYLDTDDFNINKYLLYTMPVFFLVVLMVISFYLFGIIISIAKPFLFPSKFLVIFIITLLILLNIIYIFEKHHLNYIHLIIFILTISLGLSYNKKLNSINSNQCKNR